MIYFSLIANVTLIESKGGINRVMFAYYPGKCEGSVCTTLTACMTDPSSSSCTGTYSAATTMPALATSVSLLQVTVGGLNMV